MTNLYEVLQKAIIKALEKPELKKDYITWKEGTHNGEKRISNIERNQCQ